MSRWLLPEISRPLITTSGNDRPPVEGAEPPEVLARVVNPLIKVLLRSPLHRPLSEHLILLAFRGRKSGNTYEVVVGHHVVNGALVVPTGRRWRLNFRGGLGRGNAWGQSSAQAGPANRGSGRGRKHPPSALGQDGPQEREAAGTKGERGS